jgi:Raf kinase inhibitor-like YbhB/YbcL family protein
MSTNPLMYKHELYLSGVLLSLLVLSLVLPAGCKSGETPPEGLTLSLSSAAFRDGDTIPDKYTCQGEDISPPLSWSEVPAGTQSLALIVDDLDSSGGRFTHWVLFNIPADIQELPEALAFRSAMLGTMDGKNDFGNIGYGGPCPPPGKAHRYRFTLYALDCTLTLEPGTSKKQVLDAIEDHVLTRGQLIGTYQR